MYEQFLYFWLIWIFFIIIAFFMGESKKRSFLLFWILLMLFVSRLYLTVGSIEISCTFILLIIGAIILFVQQFSVYTLIVTFSLMIGYVALLIWEKITPIWFFMPSFLIIPIIIVMLVTILVQPFYTQVTIALVSASFGQLIFEFLLIVYRLHDIIGEEVFLIHVSLIVLMLIFIRFIHSILDKLSVLVNEN